MFLNLVFPSGYIRFYTARCILCTLYFVASSYYFTFLVLQWMLWICHFLMRTWILLVHLASRKVATLLQLGLPFFQQQSIQSVHFPLASRLLNFFGSKTKFFSYRPKVRASVLNSCTITNWSSIHAGLTYFEDPEVLIGKTLMIVIG